MARTAMIRARTEQELKNETEKIFHLLGLTFTEAITLFLQQVRLHRGLPFEIKIPNKITIKAIKDMKKRQSLTESKDAEDMFRKLGI